MRTAGSLAGRIAILVWLASFSGCSDSESPAGQSALDFEISNLQTKIGCYRDNSSEWTLKALVYSPTGRSGTVSKWAFRIINAGQVSGTVDETSYSQYGLRVVSLETRITASSAEVQLKAERQPPSGHGCSIRGVSGADQVRFEATVAPDKGSRVDLVAVASFVFDMLD
jgi:hypothetical protein